MLPRSIINLHAVAVYRKLIFIFKLIAVSRFAYHSLISRISLSLSLDKYQYRLARECIDELFAAKKNASQQIDQYVSYCEDIADSIFKIDVQISLLRNEANLSNHNQIYKHWEFILASCKNSFLAISRHVFLKFALDSKNTFRRIDLRLLAQTIAKIEFR